MGWHKAARVGPALLYSSQKTTKRKCVHVTMGEGFKLNLAGIEPYGCLCGRLMRGLSFLLVAFQLFCLSSAIVALAQIFPMTWLEPLVPAFYAKGITAVSGATGLTVALFLWLVQRTSNKECGIQMHVLYFWACPPYIVSFACFGVGTLIALYWGNTVADVKIVIWQMGLLFLNTVAWLVLASMMCFVFIFSTGRRQKIARTYLVRKAKKAKKEAELRQWIELLLKDAKSCIEANDGQGLGIIFKVIEAIGNKFAVDVSDCEIDINSEACKCTRFYLWAWEKMLDSLSRESKVKLFAAWYQEKIKAADMSIPELVWYYSAMKELSVDDDFIPACNFVILQVKQAESTLDAHAKDELIYQFIAAATIFQAIDNVYSGGVSEDIMEMNSKVISLLERSASEIIYPKSENAWKFGMTAICILAAENNWWEAQFAMNKDNLVEVVNEECQKIEVLCGGNPEPIKNRAKATAVT